MSSETFSSLHIGIKEDKTDALLGDSLRTNEETEEIGEATLNQLRAQREQLQTASNQARDTQNVTRDARARRPDADADAARRATSSPAGARDAQAHRLESLSREAHPGPGASPRAPRPAPAARSLHARAPPPQVIICMLVIDCALAYRLITHKGDL